MRKTKSYNLTRCLFLVLVFLFIGLGSAFADKIAKPAKKPPAKPLVLVKDSSNIATRHFNQAALAKYRSQPEFKYPEVVPESPSIWTRFWRWFWHWLAGFLHPPKIKGHASVGFLNVVLQILKWGVILAAAGVIVFFIFKLIGVDLSFLFRRKSRSIPVPYSESLENIHEIGFDEAIEQALSKHNYRLAVRLLYLKCLKQLTDAGLIKWQPQKTNSSYVNELTNAEQRAIFNSLTRRFEYVWYGEFPIDGQTFDRINLQFQEFNGKIA